MVIIGLVIISVIHLIIIGGVVGIVIIGDVIIGIVNRRLRRGLYRVRHRHTSTIIRGRWWVRYRVWLWVRRI